MTWDLTVWYAFTCNNKILKFNKIYFSCKTNHILKNKNQISVKTDLFYQFQKKKSMAKTYSLNIFFISTQVGISLQSIVFYICRLLQVLPNLLCTYLASLPLRYLKKMVTDDGLEKITELNWKKNSSHN